MAQAASAKGRKRRRKSGSRSSSGGGMLPWLLALAGVAGVIAFADNARHLKPYLPSSLASLQLPHFGGSEAKPPASVPAPVRKPEAEAARVVPADLVGKRFTGTFYFCGTSGLDNCVVDGATFWFKKQQISLADISAPRTEDARCPQERSKGFAAKVRLRDILNAGAFELTDWPNRNEDNAGRQLRVVLRNGASIGRQMVHEGLVHGVADANKPWC
ncbi:thermonuclease family protein [Rhizobium helianthi]|uniref:Thermonuclease family protein n=1 Tax=Rhizobium helianthi TaxID=1132695 RepID=A0ABW4M151_9HYPH